MRISKDDFTGIGQVYRFTLLQMLKGKGNLIAIVILLIFSLAAVPVMTLMMGGNKIESTKITAVYVQNESGYDLALADVQKEDPAFADTTFSETDWTEDSFEKEITSSEVYVHITRDMQTNGFKITGFMRDDAVFPRDEMAACTDALSMLLDETRLKQQNVAPDQMDILMSDFETQVETVEEYQNTDEENFDARFNLQLLYCVLILMLCTFVSTYVIQIVVQEKASRLSEFLMVSVRPLAMLLGKVFAMMTYVFGMLLLYALAFFVSYRVTGLFADTAVLASMFGGMGITPDTFRLSWDAAAVVLISLFLGYLTISLFSGLLGAGCSTMEDVEPSNLAVVLTVLAGYFVSVILSPAKGTVPMLISTLVPVVSMFAAPVRYLLGDIGFGLMLLSWLIQLLVIALLAYMSAKVYRDLLLYRGGRMKLGGYFSLLRQNKAGRSRTVRSQAEHGGTEHGRLERGQAEYGGTEHGRSERSQAEHGGIEHGRSERGRTEHSADRKEARR